MRKKHLLTLIVLGLCALLIAGIGLAQPKPTDEEKPKPLKYTIISAASIQRSPEDFLGAHVQLQDLFGSLVEESEFPDDRDLRNAGITRTSHYAFLTNNVSGSNMICFLARDNEDAEAFFEGPLAPLSPIYIMGRIGKQLVTDQGLATVCLVDRAVRGAKPPAPPKIEKIKSITFKVEYDVQTRNGIVRQKHRTYKIPKAGTSYEIIDPYTGKKLYMTFTF